MQVDRIEAEDTTLLKIRFRHTDEVDFKAAIKTWIQANLLGMNYAEVFERMDEFRAGVFIIDMTGLTRGE